MTNTLSNMKKHTCPTCGGQLRINVERQMYECPFCGVSFDYEYFREDDVLDLAARSLKAGEFLSADEAYSFMLQKEPHNFIALRGKILVAASAKSMKDLKSPNRLRTLGFERVDPAADAAVESAKTEHKEYFSKLKELFDLGKEYKETVKKIDESKAERDEKTKEMISLADEGMDPYVELPDPIFKDETVSLHPKTVIKGVIALFVVWCIILVCIASILSKNPYVSDPDATTTATTTHRVIGGYVPGLGYVDTNSNNSGNFRATGAWYGTSASESRRLEQAEKWERDHADDKSVFMALAIIPGIICVIIILCMVLRMKEIERCQEAVGRIAQSADKIGEKKQSYEAKAASLRAEMGKVFRELSALDPFPEAQLEKPKDKIYEWGKWN